MIERELNVGDVFYSIEAWRDVSAVTIEHKIIDGAEWTRSIPRDDSVSGGIMRCTLIGKSTTTIDGDVGEYGYDLEAGSRYFAEINATESSEGNFYDPSGQVDEWYIDDADFLTLEEAQAAYNEKRNAL